jgi:hypothetical protein
MGDGNGGRGSFISLFASVPRGRASPVERRGHPADAMRRGPAADARRGPDFLRLANALSALYPRDSEEKRLLDAMLLAVPR